MKGFALEPSSLDGLHSYDNLLQSPYWAAVKRRFGSEAMGFTVVSDSRPIVSALSGAHMDRLAVLLFIRKLPGPGDFSIGYVPNGPDIELAKEERQDFLTWLAGDLKPHIPKRCVLLRFDLPWNVRGPDERDTALEAPFTRAAVDVQVPDTVIVNLTDTEDDILARMKPKTRYNIRLSGRKGVTVRTGAIDDLDLWYDMARETAGRDRITLHAKSYFASLFEEAAASDDVNVELLIAEVSGNAVAAIVTTVCGSRCIYHFGASRTGGRNSMPTYALQWEAIIRARAAGCQTYDLFGIPPDNDPKHPLYGLFRMKTGFGGDIVHRAGCWDYPVKPSVYRMYRAVERARNTYFKKVRKKTLNLTSKLKASR